MGTAQGQGGLYRALIVYQARLQDPKDRYHVFDDRTIPPVGE